MLAQGYAAEAASGDYYSYRYVASMGSPDEKNRGKLEFNGPRAEIKDNANRAIVVLRFPVLHDQVWYSDTYADMLHVGMRYRDNGPMRRSSFG